MEVQGNGQIPAIMGIRRRITTILGTCREKCQDARSLKNTIVALYFSVFQEGELFDIIVEMAFAAPKPFAGDGHGELF